MQDQHPAQRAIDYIESQTTRTMASGLLKSLQDLVQEAKTNSKTIPVTPDQALDIARAVLDKAGADPYVCIRTDVLAELTDLAWRYNDLD